MTVLALTPGPSLTVADWLEQPLWFCSRKLCVFSLIFTVTSFRDRPPAEKRFRISRSCPQRLECLVFGHRPRKGGCEDGPANRKRTCGPCDLS